MRSGVQAPPLAPRPSSQKGPERPHPTLRASRTWGVSGPVQHDGGHQPEHGLHPCAQVLHKHVPDLDGLRPGDAIVVLHLPSHQRGETGSACPPRAGGPCAC